MVKGHSVHEYKGKIPILFSPNHRAKIFQWGPGSHQLPRVYTSNEVEVLQDGSRLGGVLLSRAL